MEISFRGFKPIKCRAATIRKQWDNCVQQWQRLNECAIYSSDTAAFNSFVNYAEQNSGTSYIMDFSGTYAQPGSLLGRGSLPLISPCFTYITSTSPYLQNAEKLSNIVGYVEFITLADYCAKNNITAVTRKYCDIGGGSSRDGVYIINVPENTYINDRPLYDNWVIPQITWYYTDERGERQTGRNLMMNYYFAISSYKIIKYTPSVGTHTYFPYTFNFDDPPFYGAITAPYYSTYDNGTNIGGQFMSGYVQATAASDGSIRRVMVGANNPVYVTVQPVTSSPAGQSYYLHDFVNINVPFLSKTFAVTQNSPDLYTGSDFAIYPNAQTAIDYFADFGVTITTDIKLAIDPPPEQDIINPDNPSDPLPSFPDNTTEITPIEKSYITPATFGQSGIYNSLSIRDFMRWISDNTVDISNWKRLFVNPADVVQGINIFNLDLVAHDTARTRYNEQTNILGVTKNIPNYSMLDGYNNIVDGGTLNLMAYYGNYADYTSMSYQCFIPFVGYISMRASDVVNRTLHLYYAVDFATGAAIAFLNSDEKLIYTAPCTVCGKIPLSISDKNSQTLNNTLSILGGLGGVIGGVASGNPLAAVGAGAKAISGLQLQTHYATRGSMSGVNIYKLLPAFIERTRYDLFLPSGEQTYLGAKYQSWTGAPSTQFAALKDCVDDNGYIQCDVAILPNCTATEQEKNQIRDLIKSGIYI